MIAVINSGSSSIKFQLIALDEHQVLVDGLVEGIGEPQGRVRARFPAADGHHDRELEQAVPDHRVGLELLLELVGESGAVPESKSLDCVGHRLVHGGEAFREPTLITDEVLQVVREQSPLAPLHNPPNLVGVEAAMHAYPGVPQVGVFDTAFHQTMPEVAYLYALPYDLYEKHGVRRYGFHGTSHRYVSRAAARHLEIPLEDFNAIVFHLGNGASVTAVEGGKSVDTSMGLTPLEGLVMGTRSGDVDPALHTYLARAAGMSADDFNTMLNRRSGLKGLCGDNDMRRIRARAKEGDRLAQLAFDVFCYRARKYLGAYYAVLGRVDAIVFTAGIGEHDPSVRARICDGLERLGIEIDAERNESGDGMAEISSEDSAVKVLVVPTAEELEIAMQAKRCVESGP